MDRLQKNKMFLTHYEIEEGKITEYYGDNSKVTNIPNIPHNIEVCERKLLRQHLEAKENQRTNFSNMKKVKTAKISILVSMGVMALTISSYTGIVVTLYCIASNILDIQLEKRKIWRLMITDYCLEHATSLKFSKHEAHISNKLSEQGQQTFKQDHGFSLNHAHLYTNNDLKELKKVIGQ